MQKQGWSGRTEACLDIKQQGESFFSTKPSVLSKSNEGRAGFGFMLNKADKKYHTTTIE